MEHNRPYWKVIVSLTFSLIATAFVIFAGVWLIDYLMPFVVGWVIAWIANPVVCWLETKLKIKKKLGSAIIIVLVLAAIGGILYLIASALIKEGVALVKNMPELYQTVVAEADVVSDKLSGVLKVLPKGIREAGTNLGKTLMSAMSNVVAKLSEPTVSMAGNVAMQIPSLIIATFVTILSAYFFVADRETVLAWARKVTPSSIYKRMSMVVSNFKYAVGGYFKAQFKIMLVVGLIIFVGLSFLGVHYALVLALLISFIDFLPFLGTGFVFVPWSIYTILVGDYKRAIVLVIIYIITQVVRQIIQPKLVGDGVGLNPLPTLIFIYIGYKLGGVIWMILAVPIGMIIINMVKAGAFKYITDDVKILVNGIMSLRAESDTKE